MHAFLIITILPPLLYRKNLVHHPLSCLATARDRVAVVMEQGVERHNMTKSQGSWMGRKLCCILVVPLDLGNSEEGCIPPYQTVSNKRNGIEEMWQELIWHFCPTWSMDVSRLFVTSCATQQNLPQRRIKRVSNMRSGWNEETCHKHDTSVRLGRWSKRNDTSVRLFANGCTWLKTNNHFVSNYLWVKKILTSIFPHRNQAKTKLVLTRNTVSSIRKVGNSFVSQ